MRRGAPALFVSTSGQSPDVYPTTARPPQAQDMNLLMFTFLNDLRNHAAPGDGGGAGLKLFLFAKIDVRRLGECRKGIAFRGADFGRYHTRGAKVNRFF